MRNVPVVRRQLTAQRARTLAAGAALGLAVMLVLLLDGLWAGVLQQAATFERHSGADLVVMSPGATSLFAHGSRVGSDVPAEVQLAPGVRAVSGVTTTYAIVGLHDRKVAVSLVGADPARLGQPWSMAAGRRPERDGEVAVDRTLARRHGIDIGDRLDILGGDLVVVGLTDDTAAFMTPFVFTTNATAGELVGRSGAYSAVLIDTSTPGQTRATLEAEGFSVRSTADLAASAEDTARRVYGTPLRLMVAVALATGVLLAALTGYAAVAERQRDYAVLKALGAGGGRLAVLALRTTAATAISASPSVGCGS
jgi:putative ABC transport system permease protein